MHNRLRILAILVGAGLLLSPVASGYYHFIHFASLTGTLVPIPEKYDLTALRNNTVYYFISDQSPTAFAPGDSLNALISQIRLAMKTWNDVTSSNLRLAFGGIAPTGLPMNTPAIDVRFEDDIPPGLLALGGVETVGTLTQTPNGNAFFPIVHGFVKIPHDLSATPSYAERLFRSLVHETGHALGLQHTLTSAVMSTEITRATTRAKPLADDDIAGISILYPTGTFLSQTATITGHVLNNGSGVNLASVVAISANASAISTLTNPDGSYTLQGIPPGSYYVYAHPLPPPAYGETYGPANIMPPQDANGNPIPATGYFTTQFYPGTRDPNAATPVFLSGGASQGPIDFSVQMRNLPAVSSVTTYAYEGQNAVYPAPLVGTGTGGVLVATGTGLVSSSGALAPGLRIDVLAEAGATVPSGTTKYYTGQYLQFNTSPGFGWSPGPRHLLFWTQDDMYVLPSSLLMVANQGPSISAVTPTTDNNGNRAALITGSNFDSTTRVLFDGAPAVVIRQNPDGSLLVTPPPAFPGYAAIVVALNGDGQSSLFQLFPPPNGAPTYTYNPSDGTPSLTFIYPNSLTPGSEATVEIDAVNSSFIDGQTVVGFGSSDIAVRQAWVVSPTRILLNVSVSQNAAVAATNVTVTTGLQLLPAPQGFSVTAPASAARQLSMTPPVVSAATGAPGAPAGGVAIVNVPNLTAPANSLTLTVAGQPALILSAGNGQVTFQTPVGLPAGPAVVRLQDQAGDSIAPIVMNINPPPPAITSIYSSEGVLADSTHPAYPGTIIQVLVSGLPATVLTADPATVTVNVAGLNLPAFSIGSTTNGTLVQVTLSPTVTTGPQIPVMLTYGGVTSQAVLIPIQ
jgi:uncharacterized protein (TIGR03437 family)